MWLLIIRGLSVAGHALLGAGFLQLMLTCSCCPWREAVGSEGCSPCGGWWPCLLRAGRVLSASCFFVWVIEPMLCMSNGVVPHQGMGRMDVFFKGWPGWMCFSRDGPWLAKKNIWMVCRALLPTYCMTFSKLFRARPKLLVLGNTHGHSARKTLWFGGETEGCWEPGVELAGAGGRIFRAGRVLSLNDPVHFKGRVQGTRKLTFQASLLGMRVWTSSASQTRKHWDSIFSLHPGMEGAEDSPYHEERCLKWTLVICHWFISCPNPYDLARKTHMFL